jgi:hypothetical protein
VAFAGLNPPSMEMFSSSTRGAFGLLRHRGK